MERTITFLMAVCVVLSLAACGQVKEPATDSDGTSVTAAPIEAGELSSQDTMSLLYNERVYPFEGGRSVKGIARIDNHLLLYGNKDQQPGLGISDYTISDTGRVSVSPARMLELPEPEAVDEASIRAVTAGGDGYFYVLTGELPGEYFSGGEYILNSDYQGRYAILRYTADGEFTGKMSFDAWPEPSAFGITVDSEGNLFVRGNSTLALFRWQEGMVHSVNTGEASAIASATLTSQGVVLAGDIGDGSESYFLADSQTGELHPLSITDPYEDGRLRWSVFTSVQGLDGEYIANTGDSFIELDFEADACRELLAWNMDRSSQVGLNTACRLSETTFVGTANADYLLVSGEEQIPYQEQSTVKVAIVSDSWSYWADEFKVLSNASPDYAYEVTGYSDAEAERLLTSLSAGDTPDLVIFVNNLDTKSAYFDDLYTFIDNDPDLSRESFIPNFLESLTYNGELHQLCTSVSITTLAARVSDVGDGYGLTPADYNRIVAESDHYETVFNAHMSRINTLYWIANIGISGFVDRANATCNFDSHAFQNLLAWCGDMGDDIPEGTGGPMYTSDQVVLTTEYLSSFLRVSALREILGEPYIFVGFPTGEEGFSYYELYGKSMAIPAGAKNKEGAWAYIKDSLSIENQMKDAWVIPVRYEALRRLGEKEFAANGADVEECMTVLENLLKSTHYVMAYSDEPLKDIILECGMSFLNGERTAEEAAALIQSRASVYMAEQYG